MFGEDAVVPARYVLNEDGSAISDRTDAPLLIHDRPSGRIIDDPHPSITGLLALLPPAGSEWPRNQRDKWLMAAESVFGLVYKEEEEGQ